MTTRTGGCLCGVVRFVAENVPAVAEICHCAQCRRWTGSALVGVTVPKADVTWQGADQIGEFQSSDWARRGFCKACGSSLYFQFTQGPDDWVSGVELMLGLFDDPNGFTIRNEIFIDHKPDAYAFAASDRTVLTRADVIEKAPHVGG